jgi:branched-chain amino acid transport system ATP-binding protein
LEALRVQNLSKNFGNVQALCNLSLSVEFGECRGIIGPNGAGKTTLINLISGEIPPSSGRIFALGQDITALPSYKRTQIGISRNFQINNLFLRLTVFQNVRLAIQAFQKYRYQLLLPVGAFKQLFDSTKKQLEQAGLWEKQSMPVSHLSYGEQRKLELVLALASVPQMVLLDEPTAGLSGSEASDVLRFVRNIGQEAAVVMIAHDIDILFGLADRITVLHHGQLLAEGTPQQIRSNDEVNKIYMGIEQREG